MCWRWVGRQTESGILGFLTGIVVWISLWRLLRCCTVIILFWDADDDTRGWSWIAYCCCFRGSNGLFIAKPLKDSSWSLHKGQIHTLSLIICVRVGIWVILWASDLFHLVPYLWESGWACQLLPICTYRLIPT